MKNDAKMLHTAFTAQKATGGCVLCVCMRADGENTRENAGLALLLSTGLWRKRTP